MRWLAVVILLGSFVCPASTDQGSCVGRCADGFNDTHKCQCDNLCHFYKSCCVDYSTVCRRARGDVFTVPEDDEEFDVDIIGGVTGSSLPSAASTTALLRTTTVPETATEPATTTLEPEPKPNDLCSDKESFDAFTDLKNGSIFAFRGDYFYELDSYSFREGYPKRISDVWGIPGPIDTAFTRLNCEGKTYIFKGDSYWRFDDGKLDPRYPRKIKRGFPGIPSNLDASFALPASNINGNERAYFFKGNQYWQYVFKHQPKRSECLKTSESVPFQRYAITMLDPWESLYELLFQSSASGDGAIGPGSVSRDWLGLPSHVDAAMTGKLLMIRQDVLIRQRGRNKPKSRRWKKKKHHSSSMEFDFYMPPGLVPSQSVYFFAQGIVLAFKPESFTSIETLKASCSSNPTALPYPHSLLAGLPRSTT
uniref:Vitronectin n=1 Tax=Callorhinchus milii TaxID=7868 RepID=A0A4W3ILY7_CALMI